MAMLLVAMHQAGDKGDTADWKDKWRGATG